MVVPGPVPTSVVFQVPQSKQGTKGCWVLTVFLLSADPSNVDLEKVANIIVDQSLKDCVFSKEAGRICYTIIQVRAPRVTTAKHLDCAGCPEAGPGEASPQPCALTPPPASPLLPLVPCSGGIQTSSQRAQAVSCSFPAPLGNHRTVSAWSCIPPPLSHPNFISPPCFFCAHRQRANKLARASSGGAC